MGLLIDATPSDRGVLDAGLRSGLRVGSDATTGSSPWPMASARTSMGVLRVGEFLLRGWRRSRLWRSPFREPTTLRTSTFHQSARHRPMIRRASVLLALPALLSAVLSVSSPARSSEPADETGALTILGSGALDADDGARGEYAWAGWTEAASPMATWWIRETLTTWASADTPQRMVTRFIKLNARTGVALVEQYLVDGSSAHELGFSLHREGLALCVRDSSGTERSRAIAESGTAASIALAELCDSVPHLAELARIPRTFDPESGVLLSIPLLGGDGAFRRNGDGLLVATTSAHNTTFASQGVRRGPAKGWRSRSRDGDLGLATEFYIAAASGDRSALESLVDLDSVLQTSSERGHPFPDREALITYLSKAYRSPEIEGTGGDEWTWGGVLMLPGSVNRRDDGWIMVSDAVGVRTGLPADPRIKAIRWLVEILVDPSAPARYPGMAAIRFRVALRLVDRTLLASLTQFESLSLDHGPRGQFARDAVLKTWTSVAPSIKRDWSQILGTYNALAKSIETTVSGVARASVRFRSDSPGFLYDFERLDGAWRLVGVHRDNPPK